MKRNYRINFYDQQRFDAATDAGGSGGGGNGSLLTGNNGGSASAMAQGQQGAINQANAGAGNANSANAGAGAQGNAAPNWRSSLPAELQADPSIQMFNDVAALTKSYISAQKMVGSEKISIPNKHATEDDWKQTFEKLGLPKDLKEYELKMEGGINPKFKEAFKENAFKAGILPAQAQKLATWFQEVNASSEAEVAKQMKAKYDEDLKGLQTEWGNAFQQNLSKASQVIREAGDPELIKYLDASGLGNDTKLIKLLAGVANKFMKEDSAVGGNNGMAPVMTPAAAQKAANAIMSDFKHPYHDSQHANHKAAVAEVQSLFEMAHPKK